MPGRRSDMLTRPVTESPAGQGWAGIGLDIVSVSRVRRLLAEYGEPFFDRMLTPGEIGDCATSTGLDMLGLCGRIAAKEAVFKALRVGNHILPWRDIVIRRTDGGWPLVDLRGRAAALAAEAGIHEITVSISHDVDYAVAVAAPIAAGPRPRPGHAPNPHPHEDQPNQHREE